MDRAACMDLLNEAEAELPVDQWTVGSLPVWPIARERLWWNLNDMYAQARRENRADRPVARRLRRATDLIHGLGSASRVRLLDAPHHATLRAPADIVALGDNVSRIWINGSWYDRLCEPLIEAAGALGLRDLHLDPYHLYRTPRHHRSHHVQPALDQIWIRSRLRPPASLPTADLPGYGDLLSLLVRHGVDPNVVTAEHVRRQAWLVRLAADYFGRVLARVGARAGVLVD